MKSNTDHFRKFVIWLRGLGFEVKTDPKDFGWMIISKSNHICRIYFPHTVEGINCLTFETLPKEYSISPCVLFPLVGDSFVLDYGV